MPPSPPLRCVECGKAIRSPRTDEAALVRVLVYTTGGIAKWQFNFHRRCAGAVAVAMKIASVGRS